MALHLVTQRGPLVCALSNWDGEPGCCRWCGGTSLIGSTWCSADCEFGYRSEHEWATAHSAALTRDQDRCRECGNGPDRAEQARSFIRAMIPLGPVAAAELWRSHEWMSMELSCSVDVVHRLPTIEGYSTGCHNHLDLLTTVCRSCQQDARPEIDLRTG